MLRDEERKLQWEYNVPFFLEFDFKKTEGCTICADEKVKKWSAPYLVANVPYDKIVYLLQKWFGFKTTEQVLENHRDHIIEVFKGDEDLRNKIIEDMKIIDQELGQEIDEKKVLESTLRSLYARKLLLEKEGKINTREWFEVVSKIIRAVELKAKIKGDIKEGVEQHVSMGDLIDVRALGVNVNATRAGTEVSKEGDKQQHSEFD